MVLDYKRTGVPVKFTINMVQRRRRVKRTVKRKRNGFRKVRRTTGIGVGQSGGIFPLLALAIPALAAAGKAAALGGVGAAAGYGVKKGLEKIK